MQFIKGLWAGGGGGWEELVVVRVSDILLLNLYFFPAIRKIICFRCIEFEFRVKGNHLFIPSRRGYCFQISCS